MFGSKRGVWGRKGVLGIYIYIFLKVYILKYLVFVCSSPDGRVIKALHLGSDVQLHAWVRIVLLANIFCLT